MIKFYMSIIGLLVLLTGCSHQINITPNLDRIRSANVKMKDINVAYYLPAAKKNLEVVTAGGGGDSVKYKPYADTEVALNEILISNFKHVYMLESLNDSSFITDKKIDYIFEPRIDTTSSSASALTWPPTSFTMFLTLKSIDLRDQSTKWELSANSAGYAEFDEFKNDFALAGRRAAEDTYYRMSLKLNESDHFKEGINK